MFDCFKNWKAQWHEAELEGAGTDGGGEYTSARFEEILKCEGIRHERTIPRTPE